MWPNQGEGKFRRLLIKEGSRSQQVLLSTYRYEAFPVLVNEVQSGMEYSSPYGIQHSLQMVKVYARINHNLSSITTFSHYERLLIFLITNFGHQVAKKPVQCEEWIKCWPWVDLYGLGATLTLERSPSGKNQKCSCENCEMNPSTLQLPLEKFRSVMRRNSLPRAQSCTALPQSHSGNSRICAACLAASSASTWTWISSGRASCSLFGFKPPISFQATWRPKIRELATIKKLITFS